MDREQLIECLRKIGKDSYLIPEGESISSYTELMLEHIGDTDPELRDELIYSIFSEWICEKEYYDEEELKKMLIGLLDADHLFFHIGDDGDNSVFTRTFSVLVVVLILIRHRRRPFLDMEMFSAVKAKLISYYEQEKDLRGYHDDYGWAHGAAHGADAMDELVLCEESGEAVCIEILDAVKKVLWNGRYPFYSEEDERIARVVYRMMKKGSVPADIMDNWIKGLADIDTQKTRTWYITRVNSKNFIRSLYFKITLYNCKTEFLNTLVETEKRLNRFFTFDMNM